MSTLWIFGDSFAVFNEYTDFPIINDNQWHRLVGQHLGYDVVYNSHCGTSLEWLYYRWDETRDQMKPGDVAVACLTSSYRRWLIKDDLFHTLPYLIELSKKDSRSLDIDSRQIKAFELYFRYLHHNNMDVPLLENWLYNAEDLARTGVRVIVIPCFGEFEEFFSHNRHRYPHVHIAQGNLFAVSRDEHEPDLRDVEYVEGRHCHLTPPNCKVLAEKIATHVASGEPIDLDSGFHKSLINQGNLESPELFVQRHELRVISKLRFPRFKK